MIVVLASATGSRLSYRRRGCMVANLPLRGSSSTLDASEVSGTNGQDFEASRLASIAEGLERESDLMRIWLARTAADLDRIERENEENKRLTWRLMEHHGP
ncbi:hypothetical protein E3C22_22610 [Jiella endophytica]|uniref:Uncharacterized protein n=1 Tax=Jiella endophytica TaxID=2558362 RepID=A0A4Y8RA75_9HYPH|nr:hypothetical protein [Jiella endophytica]TFF17930.1 hypothetical protein E3C22_22610 [Jiella endophytica]